MRACDADLVIGFIAIVFGLVFVRRFVRDWLEHRREMRMLDEVQKQREAEYAEMELEREQRERRRRRGDS